MEKSLQEDEIKELEEEIDLAVDRLFVEKRKGIVETLQAPGAQEFSGLLNNSLESNSFESVKEIETDFDFEASLTAPPPPQPPPPTPPAVPSGPSYLKSFDQLEAQLLSLEWEISGERLAKTQEAVKVLRHTLKQREDVGSVLGLMKDLLDQMRADEEAIRPPMIKFLLDAKETVKLLLRQETDKEITTYKQLALEGIDARYGALRGMKEVPDRAETLRVEEKGSDPSRMEQDKGEALRQWNSFFEKTEGILQQINQRLSRLEKVRQEPLLSYEPQRETPPRSPLPLFKDITVFKVGGNLLGVESEGIQKLFNVPSTFQEKYAEQSRIRVREDDVTLIDLKKIFPEESWKSEGAVKLLMLRGERGETECKGMIVEQVLKRLLILPEPSSGDGKPLLGKIRWLYEAHPVDVPILDFKKL